MVRVAHRSKAVTAVEEIRFEHGLDNARYRSLGLVRLTALGRDMPWAKAIFGMVETSLEAVALCGASLLI